MIPRFLLTCLTACAFSSITASAAPGMETAPETEIVPESYISIFFPAPFPDAEKNDLFPVPFAKINLDPTGLEKLANRFYPKIMAPVFHVYRTGDRGRPPLKKPYPHYGVSFEIERNFPKDAPEIACIITGGGSGFFRETVLLFQRKKDNQDGWRQMAEFFLQNPEMPWYLNGAAARRILLTRNCLTITVGESGTFERKLYGRIKYSFQLEEGIYKSRSILISGMENDQKSVPLLFKSLIGLLQDFF